MKRLSLVIVTACVILWAASAMSYETTVVGDIELDGIIAVSANPPAGIAAAVSSSSSTLYIINLSTLAVTNKIQLPVTPASVILKKNNTAVIASLDGTLSFVDIQSGILIKTISAGIPIKKAIMGGDAMLYIASGSGIAIIDASTGAVIRYEPLQGKVTGMDFDHSSGLLLVTVEGEEGIALYDSSTLKRLEVIRTGASHSDVAVNPSTHIAVALDRHGNNIFIVDIKKKSLIKTIPSREGLGQAAIDPYVNIAVISHKGGILLLNLENPVPEIGHIVPSDAGVGESGFVLTIEGLKFVRDSRAQFNRADVPTHFIDNSLLQADIFAGHLSSAGDVPVTVTNPAPGGGISNALPFRIYNPAPAIESVMPETVAAGSTFNIRVRGKNFFNGSTINLNGEDIKTRFISSILLEAVITPLHIKKEGRYPVIVMNPASHGGIKSNVLYLNAVEETAALLHKEAHETDKEKSKAKGEGSLKGRILNTYLEPLEGVSVKIKNQKTTTDAGGYFLLEKIPGGKNLLLLDGATEKKKKGRYPTIPLTVNIQENKMNEMPFKIYLHRQKDKDFKNINPNEDTTLKDPDVPGFEMRIPKGVKIIGWDNKPNLKVSVRTVPTDRLPVKPLPENAGVRTVYMFYFDKVGGGTPDKSIPIKAKNDLNLLPGEKAVLWYYDESPVEDEAPNDWAVAGTGTVTPDGMHIVSDPGVGIPKFCCGAAAWGAPPPPDPPNCCENPCNDGCCGGGGSGGGPGPGGPNQTAGDPVDLSTGYFLHAKTDMYVPGIIPVSISRYYRSRESGSAVTGLQGLGAFGKGTYFEYDWKMTGYDASGNINNGNPTMYLLVKPGNYQFRFAKQADGTFINTNNPSMRSAVVTKFSDNSKTLRMRDGWTYKFAPSGGMIEMSDKNGNMLTFVRRSDYEGGYLKEIITSEGNRITFNQTFTGIFRTDSIVDHTGRTVGYTYETDPFSPYQRLKKVTYPDGGSIEYRYDSSGRMSEIINEKGVREVLNEYDSNNRVIKQTHIDGGVYTFNYTLAGGNITETSMISPNGAATTWRFYDDTGAYRGGFITRVTTAEGVTKYERDIVSNLITSVTDPLGRVISYTYYPNGLLKTETDNLGNVTSYEYEPAYGLPTKITDPLGNATTIAYTMSGGKVTKTDIRDPLSNLTTINYNTFGMPTSIKDPNNNTSTFMYDNAGRPAELTKLTDPLNNSSLMAYDSLGRLAAQTDATGKSTLYNYDVIGRMTAVTDPMGKTTRYGYSTDGKLITVTDAKNQTIRYDYDNRGRLKKMTDPLGRVETYTYDTSDNLASMTDRKGQTTSYTYDLMNRITRAAYADGSHITYAYDTAGRLITITDSATGAVQYTYNDFGCSTCTGRGRDRIAKEVTPLGTIDYTYDKMGRRTSMTVAGQPVVNYTYDAAGRMTGISGVVGGQTRTYPITYDNASRKTSVKIPTSTANKFVTTTYGYDMANRLLSMVHQGTAAQLENLLYEYDPNGDRTKFTRNAVQPMRTAVNSANYDSANEMLTFTPAVGAARNMTYDNNGNMTSITNNCGTTNYTWNVRNQLVRIQGFNANCSALTASFKYDALGRRIEKTINGVTTRYLYDGLDIIQEKEQNGAVTANYIRTLNIDEPLTRIKGTTVRHYVTDALGSVIGLTDDTGVMKTTYTYDPFGNTTVSGEASDNPFQYTGRENDGTGLYYYRARYYSPDLQRFISEDPIGLKGGDVNFYAYVGNNPVNWVDPEGTAIPPLVGAIACSVPVVATLVSGFLCNLKPDKCRPNPYILPDLPVEPRKPGPPINNKPPIIRR